MDHKNTIVPQNSSILISLLIIVMQTYTIPAFSEEPDSNEVSFYRRAGYSVITWQLNGELPAKPFLIVDTIEIARGTTLSIDPGALLYFKPGAVVLVNGSLTCRGTSQTSISFTKMTENSYFRELPDSADSYWEGIILGDSARLDFRYTIINGSRKGILIPGKDNTVVCEHVLMRDNGKSLVYHNRVIPIIEGEFFSITLSGDDTLHQEPVYTEAKRCPAFELEQKVNIRPHKKLRIAFCISAGVGAAAAISGWIVNTVYYDRYSHATDWNRYSVKTVTQWETYTKAGKIASIAGISLTGAALGGFGMTFFF